MDRAIARRLLASTWSRLQRNSLRIQVLGVFVVLMFAVWAITLVSLYLAKKGFRDNYYQELDQRLERVESILTSTAGELALQNTPTVQRPAFSPYVLNVSALDVQSPRKAFDTVAQSGCLVTFGKTAEGCAVLGNQAMVGAYLYIVGWFEGPPIIPHESGKPITSASRLEIGTDIRGYQDRWLVVFQGSPRSGVPVTTGTDVDLYATGYRIGPDDHLENRGRDEKELRGRLNYSPTGPDCVLPGCSRRWQFSFRMPIEAFRGDSMRTDVLWPPADFREMKVTARLFPQADAEVRGEPAWDTTSPQAKRKYSLESEIGPRFKPQEQVSIFNEQDRRNAIYRSPKQLPNRPSLLTRLANTALSWIPGTLAAGDEGHVRRVTGNFGAYVIVVEPDEEIADAYMRPFAVQLITMLGGTLLVIMLAWGLVEWRLVRRVHQLTFRSNAMSANLRGAPESIRSEFGELQGTDELGVLARGIHELLQRVNEDLRDRRSRLKQLQDLWSAIGHEIVSPLHSLALLHPQTTADDASRPYIARMEAAVSSLISAGSLESATWNVSLAPLDLDEFLQQLSENTSKVAGPIVTYESRGAPLMVKADDLQLDQVLSHVLNNAKAFSPPDAAIRISLDVLDDQTAAIKVYNAGPKIPEALLKAIFELGVSEGHDQLELFHRLHRGQGLFVARQLMTGMGGSIDAENVEPTGVQFVIGLQRIVEDGR